MIAFVILCCVFVLIALGQALRLHIAIWQIMVASAVLMVLIGQIGPLAAVQAINWQVIVFLAGMFLLGESLRQSGLIARFCTRVIHLIPGSRAVLLVFMLACGLLSALVTNDTLAVIATPVAILLARQYGLRVRLPLLALALSVTLGSALSPLGNSQNLRVALDPALKTPFTDFLWWLGLPSLLSIGVAWGMLLLLFRRDFAYEVPAVPPTAGPGLVQGRSPTPGLADVRDLASPEANKRLLLLSRIGLLIIIALIVWRILASLIGLGEGLPLWAIALCEAAPLLVARGHRTAIVRGLDWQTLVFFAALFISVQAVWNQGTIQQLIADLYGVGLGCDHCGQPDGTWRCQQRHYYTTGAAPEPRTQNLRLLGHVTNRRPTHSSFRDALFWVVGCDSRTINPSPPAQIMQISMRAMN